MEKVNGTTGDLTQGNIRAIADLFPSVVTEALTDSGEVVLAIDFDLLRQELSDHVTESPRERYQLDWPGKRSAVLAANAPTRSTLRPLRDESLHFDTTRNLFIEGDNLEALKLLQESYLGKVKFIYIDPPYNTGNDFIYADNFAQTVAEYLEASGQVDDAGALLVANTEANGRLHSDWLSMLLPRLRLARSLLAEDGLIVCSIDGHEVHNLVHVMIQVFGERNKVAVVPVIMNLKGNPDAFAFADSHEYLVVWARDRAQCRVGAFPVDSAEVEDWESDEFGPFKRADTLRRTGADASRERRPNGWFPVYITPERSVYVTATDKPRGTDHVELWPINEAGEELSWTWSKSKIQAESHNLLVVDGRSGLNIYKKQRPQLGDQATSKPKSVMYSPEYSSSTSTAYLKGLMGAKLFDNPKPVPLMRDLLRIAAPGPQDLVLDFFAGSGSTADAVLRQNAEDGGERAFIVIQIPEAISEGAPAASAGYRTIAELARDRIRKAGTAILEGNYSPDWNGDVGFRTLRVDSGSFKQILRSADSTDQLSLLADSDNIKADRSDEDLLFQVLVDWGLEYSLPVSVEEVDGVLVHDVDRGAIVACFAPSVSDGVVRKIAARRPLRVVFRDSSFKSDDQRINVEQVFRELSKDTQLKVI